MSTIVHYSTALAQHVAEKPVMRDRADKKMICKHLSDLNGFVPRLYEAK